MSSRRKFLRQSSALLAAWGFTSLSVKAYSRPFLHTLQSRQHASLRDAITDEDYWAQVREAFSVSPNIIDLNNAGVSPQTVHVQEMEYKYLQWSNEAPSYYMWRVLDKGREPLRQQLADLAGCHAEELAICRNSTEALDVAIHGLNLKAGDEVILARQDYPNMINAWKQREQREGIKLVWLNFELPREDDEYFVKAYAGAVSARTRIVHVTHMINWVGQLLPVKKISEAVKAKNAAVEVVCDSAQTFAHLDYKIPDLGCDYWGTSLHKWLCAPFGTGLLWVKQDKISSLWPLFGADDPHSPDIRKFEAQGTRAFPAEEAIGYALGFHNALGSARKEARLRYLKNYWAEKVKDIPNVRLHTSLNENYSCAICGVSVDGIDISALDSFLFNKYKIHTVGINWENIHCVRVSPNVYTSLKELDKLVTAITDAATNGIH